MLRQKLFDDGQAIQGEGALFLDGLDPVFMCASFEPPRTAALSAVPLRGTPVLSFLPHLDIENPWVSLRGHWYDNTIDVDELQPLDSSPANSEQKAEGVPSLAASINWHGYDEPQKGFTETERALKRSGALVRKMSVPLASGKYVLAFMASDPAAVSDALKGQYDSDSYCIIKAEWTRDQIRSSLHSLLEDHQPWRELVTGFGEGPNSQGQSRVLISTLAITDDLKRWKDTQPEGLVEIRPALWKQSSY